MSEKDKIGDIEDINSTDAAILLGAAKVASISRIQPQDAEFLLNMTQNEQILARKVWAGREIRFDRCKRDEYSAQEQLIMQCERVEAKDVLVALDVDFREEQYKGTAGYVEFECPECGGRALAWNANEIRYLNPDNPDIVDRVERSGGFVAVCKGTISDCRFRTQNAIQLVDALKKDKRISATKWLKDNVELPELPEVP